MHCNAVVVVGVLYDPFMDTRSWCKALIAVNQQDNVVEPIMGISGSVICLKSGCRNEVEAKFVHSTLTDHDG